jgi:hypothetical protein
MSLYSMCARIASWNIHFSWTMQKYKNKLCEKAYYISYIQKVVFFKQLHVGYEHLPSTFFLFFLFLKISKNKI